MRKSTFVAQLR